ncbi:hypothetical protein Bca4012_093372 [Brassica carinata]|uniref:Uncharacterized protein n=1 Tax=Brassica carinata TaxID=52824 RepID=A0A8X7PVC1_BRACI|nr:hypothetical protein Bca52824_075578 [Brassica carinata]
MTSLLMRAGSMPVQTGFIPSRKASTTISRHNSVESLPSHGGERFSGGKISIDVKATSGLRRVLSESDVIRNERMLKSVVSKPSPANIPEEEDEIRFSDGWGSLIWKESGIPAEEQGVAGGGGSGYSGGKGNGGDGYDDRSKIGDYYREMLKSNPNNSLLLMNYGKFLYEVETKRDEKRARGYFDQAVNASPGDCMVMGSYAHFMWEAEDEDDEEDLMVASPAMVSAV